LTKIESIQDLITETSDKEISDSEKALSEATLTLVKEFVLAKNFSKKQIKAMSILSSVSETMRDIILEWIINMKHLKGKYSQDLKSLLKTSFNGLANITTKEKEGFFSNLLHRDKI
jgi:hypothetical protein